MKNKIPISVQSDSLHAFYSFYALKSVLCGFKVILHHLLIIYHEYKLTIIYDYYLKLTKIIGFCDLVKSRI